MYLDGPIDFLTKAVSGASKFVTQAATGIIQGKQAFDATKAAWKGIPFAPVSGAFPPYALPSTIAAPPAIMSSRDAAAQAGGDATPAGKNGILVIQSTLKSLGYDPGPVDGISGPRTSAAIASFQRGAGLPVDGKATRGFLDQLTAYVSSMGISSQQSKATPPVFQTVYQPPLREGPALPSVSKTAEERTAEEKLWTWFIPGAAALGGLLILMSQKRGR